MMLSLADFRFAKVCPLCSSPHFDLLPRGYLSAVYVLAQSRVHLSHRVMHHRRLALCQSCGLIYHQLIPTQSTLQGLATGLDRERQWQDRSAKKIFAQLVDDPTEPRRILDVGCGDGQFLCSLPNNWEKFGVDPNPISIERAKERMPTAKLVSGYLEDLDSSVWRFDVITLWDVMEHLANVSKSLQIMHDLLKPGGMLVFETGNTDSLPARLLNSSWYYYSILDHSVFFNERSVQRGLALHGLCTLDVFKTQHHRYCSMPRVIFRGLKTTGFLLATGLGRFPGLWQVVSRWVGRPMAWGKLPGFTDHFLVVARRKQFDDVCNIVV